MTTTIVLTLIGIVAGLSAGLFGIGGGIIVVPALVHFLGYTQQTATGTSLMILLPPIGLAAALEYHRNGNANIAAAIVVAAAMFITGYFGASIAQRMRSSTLELFFGVFLLVLSIYTISRALGHKSDALSQAPISLSEEA